MRMLKKTKNSLPADHKCKCICLFERHIANGNKRIMKLKSTEEFKNPMKATEIILKKKRFFKPNCEIIPKMEDGATRVGHMQ